MKTKLNNPVTWHILFQIGIVLFPVVEIYRSLMKLDSLKPYKLQLLFFDAEELLLMLWVGALFLAGAVFAVREKRKKLYLPIACYLAVFCVYLVLHAYNAAQFDASIIPAAKPSFVVECYYVVRMYLMPICLIFAVWMLRVPFERICVAAKGAAWIIVLCVVVTDLLGVSFISYADGNVVVDGGFFSWFTLPEDADFARYTAKGLFAGANDIGSVLFALTPFLARDVIRRGRWHDVVLLALAGVAAVMIGTKISSLGFFLATLAVAILAVLEILIRKRERSEWKRVLLTLSVFVIYVPLLLISPGQKLQEVRDREAENAERPTESVGEVESVTESGKEGEFSEEDCAKLEKYVEEHHWDHFIDPWFVEIYPVRSDMQYWSELISRPNWQNSDSRLFKTALAARIVERNDRPLDRLLGIGGYTSGIPYSEKDYSHQFFVYGAVGLVVLMAPFFASFFYAAYLLLRRLLAREGIFSLGVAAVSVGALFATAYLAGHVFDTQFVTYSLALASAGIGIAAKE